MTQLPTIPAPTQQMAEAVGFGITTERLNLSRYTEEHQDLLGWWWHLAKDKGWSLKEFERRTGISSTTITRIFRGIYGADESTVMARFAKARENFATAVENPDFIMTSLAKIMFTAFDKTRSLRNVTIMWGVKGIGKTTVMKEYTRLNNHGHTFYVRCMGSGCTINQFIKHVAAAMNITVKGRSGYDTRLAIVSYLSKGNRLLIVDELHEIFLTCADRSIIQICEFLRELSDIAECGLALVGTDALHKEFFTGHHKEVLAQLIDRGTIQIKLQEKPSKGDIIAVLKHYGLTFPDNHAAAKVVLNDIIASNGLRKLTHRLRDGQIFANKNEETFTWDHFIAAFDAVQSLSK